MQGIRRSILPVAGGTRAPRSGQQGMIEHRVLPFIGAVARCAGIVDRTVQGVSRLPVGMADHAIVL